jgi:cytochrome o ubiquinol oxidase subunit 1
MFGKLDASAIPWSEPIPLITSFVLILVIVGTLILITLKKWWPYLWREWITSVDHKRIGIMYCSLGTLMLVRGFADAIMMRTQQAVAINTAGYLSPEHYDQIFTAHGTIMVLFGAMPLVLGFMNFLVPLQLGVRDVAFPTFNSVGFWLTASGALLVNVSLFVGEFARTGWLPYPPLSETTYTPGVGVDYYLWAVQISGIGTLITGINIVTTVLKMRCRGMSYLRMPVFCWTALASCLLIVAVFPILTATLAMLTLDRYVGWHYFTNTAGGNPMMFVNLVWAWGHPEVYILVLPAFGIFSEVFSTFSGKPLFGYRSMVAATLFICIVSMMVWLHHFFTMGAGAAVNTFFGISSSVIAVGTGVKIYNWIFTMYGGRVRFEPPMLWSMGFIFTFVLGGLTGVLLAIPPADFITHNSMFLVAHFHNVIVGGVVFGLLAGLEFWFPKAFGFSLHRGWGKAAFWFAFIGFWVTFAQHTRVGAVAVCVRRRRRNPRAGRDLPGDAARGQHSQSRAAARRDRRSVGRPLARMGNSIASALLQFCSDAKCRRRGSLLGNQAPSGRDATAVAGAEVRADRNASSQRRRLLHSLLHLGVRLCDGLAHLVARNRCPGRGLRSVRVVRLA